MRKFDKSVLGKIYPNKTGSYMVVVGYDFSRGDYIMTSLDNTSFTHTYYGKMTDEAFNSLIDEGELREMACSDVPIAIQIYRRERKACILDGNKRLISEFDNLFKRIYETYKQIETISNFDNESVCRRQRELIKGRDRIWKRFHSRFSDEDEFMLKLYLSTEGYPDMVKVSEEQAKKANELRKYYHNYLFWQQKMKINLIINQ